MQLAGVGKFSECAVGFGGVESQSTLIAHGSDDELGQLTDGYFFTGADVDVTVANVVFSLAIGIFEIDVLHDED